ncbi:glycan biosynthesis hexose transferase WsfD [Clostridium guangxiense]|uniref:glycan biosynthesis hexose transferase WsfD n=1 Tax=Clostridium guangxiense TaxID=1662055 RepID=UPI001E40C9E6|nr:hypothetical protein [Clostridium guangxiense]MCD2348160.1 hypothetical protein [Clostridium guangxiense]
MKLILKKLNYIKNNYLIEAIILTIIGVILLNTLFIYPIIGKMNNGDFDRLMTYGGVSEIGKSYKETYDGFMHIKYLIKDPGVILPVYWDWVSVAIPVKIAVVLSLVMSGFKSNLFDIRYLAVIYSTIFLAGVFFILRYKRLTKITKLAAGICIILFFTSTCYIEYFNSFYGEAGTIVFFFLNIGTYLHLITMEKPKMRDFMYFFIASGAFLTAKSQNLPLFIFMLIIYGFLYFYYKAPSYRQTILIGSLVVFIVCFISYFSLTDTIKENNLFQSVFTGVLRGSKTPERDLKELGLNEKLVVFDGHSFYNKNKGLDPLGKTMMKEFYPNISNWKILGFYLNNPDRMWQKINDAAHSAYVFGKPKRFNFAKNQFYPEKKVNNFRIELIDKMPNLHHSVYGYIVFSIVYFIISFLYFIKSKERDIKLLNLMLIFILVSGSSQFILPVIGAGHGDFSKHLFLLNLSYDIMFGAALLWCIHVILKAFCYVKLKISRG